MTATPSPEPPLDAADLSTAMSGLLARNWWAVMLRGVAAILFGLVALLMTRATLASLELVFAAYLLIDGVLAIVSAVKAARRRERWGLFVLEGVVDFIAAAVAFLVPGALLFAFIVVAACWGVVAACWGVVAGVLKLMAAFRLRKTHGRAWLVVGGVASIVWGVLLAVFPVTGLIVLTWWLGAYAIVFGVSMLVLGLTLRGRRVEAQANVPPPLHA
jgi:uncharacterized membrane protein HdeD (DUF308 family)